MAQVRPGIHRPNIWSLNSDSKWNFLELVDWKSIANGESETANDNQNKKRKKKKRKNGSNDGSEIGSNGTNENGIETGPEPMEIDGEIKTKKSRSQRRSEQKKKLEEKKIKDQVCSTRIFHRYMGDEIVRNIQTDFDPERGEI